VSRWSWLALGVGAYIAFALAQFPAGVALRWFAPPGVAASGVAGTLWSGSAATCSVGGLTAEQLRWRVNPFALLTARVVADVEARIPDGFVSAQIAASRSRVTLREVRGATSLPALAQLMPVRGMRGQASVALDTLELVDGWPVRATGQVKLAKLEVTPFVPTGGGLVALGDYTVSFTEASEGALTARFADDGGPLEVAGSVTLDPARVYTLDALVKPRPSADRSLVEGLSIMTAEPDAEGRRRLTMTGSL
jgi:hypothetical protein